MHSDTFLASNTGFQFVLQLWSHNGAARQSRNPEHEIWDPLRFGIVNEVQWSGNEIQWSENEVQWSGNEVQWSGNEVWWSGNEVRWSGNEA